MVLSWVEGWVPADAECWRLGTGELASVGELLGSYHDCVARFAPGSGFAEGPQAVGPGQVVCHGDIAARNTVFAGGRAVAFIDWDGIFVASPMWDLAHAVWQFAPVCGDADRWLEGWPGAPDRSARIAALVGGYGLGAGRASFTARRTQDDTERSSAAATALICSSTLGGKRTAIGSDSLGVRRCAGPWGRRFSGWP